MTRAAALSSAREERPRAPGEEPSLKGSHLETRVMALLKKLRELAHPPTRRESSRKRNPSAVAQAAAAAGMQAPRPLKRKGPSGELDAKRPRMDSEHDEVRAGAVAGTELCGSGAAGWASLAALPALACSTLAAPGGQPPSRPPALAPLQAYEVPLPHEECLQLLDAVMPEVTKLRKLQQQQELSKADVLERTKKHLHAIGQHIEQLGTQQRGAQHRLVSSLWAYVSHEVANGLSGDKLERLYQKIRASTAAGARPPGCWEWQAWPGCWRSSALLPQPGRASPPLRCALGQPPRAPACLPPLHRRCRRGGARRRG